MKKIGVITFHNSYNCGSMLESYAIHHYLLKNNIKNEIINFSNAGQKELYSVYAKKLSIKNIIKNILIFPVSKKIKRNNEKYEEFKNKYFILSEKYSYCEELKDDDYSIVIAGSDQIWNITIEDGDEAYFLPWVKNAKKIAYAPSFGAKNIIEYTSNPDKYKKMISNFDALSIREKNGKQWIKDLTGKNAELLIDPTLLLSSQDYDKIACHDLTPHDEYIFFYCPSFDEDISKFVKKVSKKYNLPVITWSSKNYYIKGIWRYGFKLPDYESPAIYLSLIKNATLIFTTSFHGTIFSTIYKKKFFVLKNGGMYGKDDRVQTLVDSLKINDRLIKYDFDENFDYLGTVNYDEYEKELIILKEKAANYLKENVIDYYESSK